MSKLSEMYDKHITEAYDTVSKRNTQIHDLKMQQADLSLAAVMALIIWTPTDKTDREYWAKLAGEVKKSVVNHQAVVDRAKQLNIEI